MNVVIAAGGSGGHLYPAVALAREFLRQEPTTGILFVGTERGIETKVLAHEALELVKIKAAPVMGLGLLRSLKGLLSLPRGIWASAGLLRRRRADLVIGIGGYTSPPVLFAAALRRIPRVILEPNAYPGMANRVLAPLADLIFVAFESARAHFPAARLRLVGTPIRRAFLDPASRTTSSGRKTLLIFGGSQGARAINDAMVKALPIVDSVTSLKDRLRIVHQTGEADYARVMAAYEEAGLEAQVLPFLFDMPGVLRGADLVVSRAGAVTIAELTACGKPAILIPLPQAIYQHQERNARVLQAAGAAEVLLQAELTGDLLASRIQTLLSDAARLGRMAVASRRLARLDAAEAIVRNCRELLKERQARNSSKEL
jgi:UDP-N-acetylglucosamine--N-acetylmuramyl-(pentapeptide) pyrophosphoryl-undecaprenol N-acetylglucosamine transferase